MIEQGSPEWLQWRKEGVGSSDAAVIMNASPWKTRLELWQEKTAAKDYRERPVTPQMLRGQELEPAAREIAESEFNCTFEPTCLVHPDHPWLRASLDGLHRGRQNIAIEIKCPGKADHDLALSGEIPNKYKWQLRHIMLCAQLSDIFYVSYMSDKDFKIIRFERDEHNVAKLFTEEFKFWNAVCSLDPPEFTDRDFLPMTSKLWSERACEFVALQRQMQQLTKRCDELKQLLIKQASGHPRVRGSGLQLIRYQRTGNVDYKRVPQLKNVDLEPYRKPATEVYMLKEVAEEGVFT